MTEPFDFYLAKPSTPSASAGSRSASASTGAPILIFVHGGAWVSGSKEQYKSLATQLALRGHCVAVAKYSLAPAVKHPKPVEELQGVIEKVTSLGRSSARSLPSAGCDPKRIYLIGHSAGAHMIAFWNTAYSNPAVKGFIGIEGIYNLVTLGQVWPGYKNWFLTKAFGEEARWKEASPALLPVKSKVPWLLIHSEKDELVDFAQTVEFKNHLEKQRVEAKLITLKNENHFAAVESLADEKSVISRAVSQFLPR